MTDVFWMCRPGSVAIVIGAFLLVGTGCDGGGSKRDALYEGLLGTWRVSELRVDGTPQGTDGEAIRFTFLERRGTRTYRVSRVVENDTTVVAEGGVDLAGERLLRMADGFRRPLIWRFTFDEPNDFSNSVRFFLEETTEDGARSFLEAIGLSGGARRIEVDLRLESSS